VAWWSREWCCEHFHWAFEARTHRGQFIFVSPPVPRVCSRYSFWLAFRSVAREHLTRMPQDPLAPPDLKICLTGMQAIFYCPWCGHRLARFYGPSAERLVDLELCQEFQVPGWEPVVMPNLTLKLTPPDSAE
jgi:hypothetical protein